MSVTTHNGFQERPASRPDSRHHLRRCQTSPPVPTFLPTMCPPRPLLPQRLVDAIVHSVLLPVEAVGVDPQQYRYPVPGAPRHVGSGNTGVQPQRGSGVPQVVRTAGQRRGLLLRRRCPLARHPPHLAVLGVREVATPPRAPRKIRPSTP